MKWQPDILPPMKRFLIYAIYAALLGTVSVARAQNLDSYGSAGTFSVAHAKAQMPQVFGALAPALPRAALRLFRVRYFTPDLRGRRVLVSGLLALPGGGAPRGLVLWHHGTTVSAAGVPSRFAVGAKPSETEAALLAFASGGYALAMPDYLGYDAGTGVHPYPFSETNSRAALDFLAPAREVARKVGVVVAAPTFVSGYSEGGAVAMWSARRLQERGQGAARSAFLSGPYDLSGVTRQSLLELPTDNAQFIAHLYLTSFLVYSWAKNHRRKLTEFFQPSFAFAVNRDFTGKLSDDAILKRLAATALLLRARNSMALVLTPGFYRAMETADAREPLVAELRRNDAFAWAPKNPTVFWALNSDGIVVANNARVAAGEFGKRGSHNVRTFVEFNTKLNHITAIAPALAFARRFFDGGFAGVPEAR